MLLSLAILSLVLTYGRGQEVYHQPLSTECPDMSTISAGLNHNDRFSYAPETTGHFPDIKRDAGHDHSATATPTDSSPHSAGTPGDVMESSSGTVNKQWIAAGLAEVNCKNCQSHFPDTKRGAGDDNTATASPADSASHSSHSAGAPGDVMEVSSGTVNKQWIHEGLADVNCENCQSPSRVQEILPNFQKSHGSSGDVVEDIQDAKSRVELLQIHPILQESRGSSWDDDQDIQDAESRVGLLQIQQNLQKNQGVFAEHDHDLQTVKSPSALHGIRNQFQPQMLSKMKDGSGLADIASGLKHTQHQMQKLHTPTDFASVSGHNSYDSRKKNEFLEIPKQLLSQSLSEANVDSSLTDVANGLFWNGNQLQNVGGPTGANDKSGLGDKSGAFSDSSLFPNKEQKFVGLHSVRPQNENRHNPRVGGTKHSSPYFLFKNSNDHEINKSAGRRLFDPNNSLATVGNSWGIHKNQRQDTIDKAFVNAFKAYKDEQTNYRSSSSSPLAEPLSDGSSDELSKTWEGGRRQQIENEFLKSGAENFSDENIDKETVLQQSENEFLKNGAENFSYENIDKETVLGVNTNPNVALKQLAYITSLVETLVSHLQGRSLLRNSKQPLLRGAYSQTSRSPLLFPFSFKLNTTSSSNTDHKPPDLENRFPTPFRRDIVRKPNRLNLEERNKVKEGFLNRNAKQHDETSEAFSASGNTDNDTQHLHDHALSVLLRCLGNAPSNLSPPQPKHTDFRHTQKDQEERHKRNSTGYHRQKYSKSSSSAGPEYDAERRLSPSSHEEIVSSIVSFADFIRLVQANWLVNAMRWDRDVSKRVSFVHPSCLDRDMAFLKSPVNIDHDLLELVKELTEPVLAPAAIKPPEAGGAGGTNPGKRRTHRSLSEGEDMVLHHNITAETIASAERMETAKMPKASLSLPHEAWGASGTNPGHVGKRRIRRSLSKGEDMVLHHNISADTIASAERIERAKMPKASRVSVSQTAKPETLNPETGFVSAGSNENHFSQKLSDTLAPGKLGTSSRAQFTASQKFSQNKDSSVSTNPALNKISKRSHTITASQKFSQNKDSSVSTSPALDNISKRSHTPDPSVSVTPTSETVSKRRFIAQMFPRDSPLPWACPSTTRWRDLGHHVFPRYVQETTCVGGISRSEQSSNTSEHATCWYGFYHCRPTASAVQVLVRHSGGCNDGRVPVNIRGHYFLSVININTGCVCL